MTYIMETIHEGNYQHVWYKEAPVTFIKMSVRIPKVGGGSCCFEWLARTQQAGEAR